MRKIPTVFLRDPEDLRRLLPEVHPDCQWVLDGEGVATRKYDGVCVLIRRDGMAVHGYARREVRANGKPPVGFWEVEHDPVTGKTVGWEPIESSSFYRFFKEALRWVGDDPEHSAVPVWLPGTYELVGPKINGNPEGYPVHRLLKHSEAPRLEIDGASPGADCDFDDFKVILMKVGALGWEGIVWHHPDGRMAKLKARDYR